MKKKSLIVFITHILAFLCVCNILGCSVESSSEEEKPVVATYTVSYSSDYATEQVYKLKPVTVQEGTVLGVEQLPVLSETDYTFIGWYDGETKVIAGAYKITKNVTLVAKWSKIGQTEEPSKPSEDEPDKPVVTYTVSYSSDKGVTDADLLKPITLSEGTAITAGQLPELSATGWSFEGWYDGETKVVAGYKVTKNITLVAKWTLNPKYTVEHWLQNIDDDDYVCKQSDSQQLYGKTGDMTNATAKNYPGFLAQEIEQAVIQPDGTTVVKIKYNRKIITVTVNLDGGNIDGNENNITAEGKFGAKTELSVNNPVKTDCHFGGWSMYIPETFPADDIEIKALWGNVYTVSYQTEKAIDSVPTTIRVLEDIVLSTGQLPELKETGWIFDGWYDGETKAISGEYVITKDVTLVAKWSPATVTYTVEHCQQNIENDEYTFLVITEQLSGKTEELTTALAKDYPGFSAQNITQSKIAADGSTVVKICYDRKIINLTFNLDGGNIDGKTEDVVVSGKYGANVSVPISEPIKTDCKFVGWDKTVPQTFPAENDVFRAKYDGSFSVIVNRDDSDLKISKSETDDFVYNITVPETYTDISYYLNGEKQEETSKDYKFKIPKRNGCFNLVVVAEKNGIKYSYSMNVVIDGLN